MTPILLVHGAWHGAWCWYKAIPALEAAGFEPHTLDLPGHGLRAGETQSLAAYADAVAERLAEIGRPAVLLGHSMGGQVISAAAERVPERISSLVYLCAFLPRAGESIFANAAGDAESVLGGYMTPLDDGRLVVKDEGLKPSLFADCAEEDIALARLMLVPQSAEPFSAPAALTPTCCSSPMSHTRRRCSKTSWLASVPSSWTTLNAKPVGETIVVRTRAASSTPSRSAPRIAVR